MNMTDMRTGALLMMLHIVRYVIMSLKKGGSLGGVNTAPNVDNELSGNGRADDD